MSIFFAHTRNLLTQTPIIEMDTLGAQVSEGDISQHPAATASPVGAVTVT